jgi:SAM-dependent methyltransferase
MARIHLFEFEDQKWFPDFLRNYMTDFLQFLSNKTGMYKPLVPLIEETLKKSSTNTIVDLGSGGGGGLIALNEMLRERIPSLKIVLTDFYPNIEAFERTKDLANNFEYESESVDARDVPVDLLGLRTQFLSFHHFKPVDARLILKNALDVKSSIAIFEAQERSIPSVLAMVFSPISVLLTTPFIRPFKLGRIIFTYFIPLVPLFVLWDGVVSSFRTYSVAEMQNLIKEVDEANLFEWKVGKIKSGPSKLLYLIGTKK